MPDFLRRVVDPAMLEVNGLSDLKVVVVPVREGGPKRGKVTGFLLEWDHKTADEMAAAAAELNSAARRAQGAVAGRGRGDGGPVTDQLDARLMTAATAPVAAVRIPATTLGYPRAARLSASAAPAAAAARSPIRCY